PSIQRWIVWKLRASLKRGWAILPATRWPTEAYGARYGNWHPRRERFLPRTEASKPRCLMGGEPNRGPMMTRICWRLVDILSRMLDADERQVVRGDFAESGQSVARAIRDVSDLVVRRQIGLWTVWQPWLALLGIACLAGLPLSRIAFRLNVDLGQQLT